MNRFKEFLSNVIDHAVDYNCLEPTIVRFINIPSVRSFLTIAAEHRQNHWCWFDPE